MKILRAASKRLEEFIDRERLVETAVKLIEVPSPTGEAGAVADRLAGILADEGFAVERPAAGHAKAPAVVARLDSGRPGRVIQWDGHLDTVHLPFAAPRVDGARIRGSGACDMKGGLAAAVEALRALRDSGLLASGCVLLTAHDLHEAPWGFGEQLGELIRNGYFGNAVLIPEPLSDRLPVVGRGAAVWRARVRRAGPPIHEVMRSADEPDVIAAAAELVLRLRRLDAEVSSRRDPLAGAESVFIGKVDGGEMYNQSPSECRLEGTRRWLPATRIGDVERELQAAASEIAARTGATVEMDFRPIRDAFALDLEDPFVRAFERAHETVAGERLPTGPKPFVDDGNAFWALARVPAITHGPLAGGQHTTDEWVSIDDLARVARVYALTAAAYSEAPAPRRPSKVSPR